MKLLWTGTDVMMLLNKRVRKLLKRPYWILFRLIVRFLDMTMIEGHATNSELLKRELKEFGFKKKIEIILTPLKHTVKYPKIKHDSFNVLYYEPHLKKDKFWHHLYGIDLIERLKEDCPTATFISVDGKADMSKVYPIIDFYVRPNRHDGNSRMVRECDIQEIPYYWSDEKPDYNAMLNKIINEIKK